MRPLYRASHKPGLMQSDLLLGDQMYHLTVRLFSTPTVADVIDYLEHKANQSENTVCENHY
jgi:hypothetical protein